MMFMDLIAASAWSVVGLLAGWYVGDEARRVRQLGRYEFGQAHHRRDPTYHPVHRRRFRRFEE